MDGRIDGYTFFFDCLNSIAGKELGANGRVHLRDINEIVAFHLVLCVHLVSNTVITSNYNKLVLPRLELCFKTSSSLISPSFTAH